MAHCNTVLNQVVSFFKRHEFESLARKHHVGGNFRSFNRWSQFIALLVGQLSGRKTLRDLVENLAAQGHKLYHLGMKTVTRTTLVRNPIFLDRVSGFDWTMIPILSGQSFSLFLPAVVAC